MGKTIDNVFLRIVVSLMYYLNPEKVYWAAYNLRAPENLIRSKIEDLVRGRVPTKKLDELFSDKVVLAAGIKDVLSEWMAAEGDGCHGSYICEKVLVTDIAPADENVKAMNQIYTQARNRISAQEKAEADKIREIKQAEAHAEGKYLMGKGVVEQRKAIVEGLK